MNVEFINPFLTATTNVLSTMAQIETIPGSAALKNNNIAKGDVTGLIGMTGDKVKGSFSISFTKAAILYITKRMVGENVTTINDTVIDMTGELTNMATGGAKKLLADKGYDFDMAIPVVIAGDNHSVFHKSNGPIIILPFTIESGEFFIEISFEDI